MKLQNTKENATLLKQPQEKKVDYQKNDTDIGFFFHASFTFLTWLPENFKLHMQLTLYFFWTVLLQTNI